MRRLSTMTSGFLSARTTLAALLGSVFAGLAASAAIADSIVLISVKDNTLINNPAQEYSNGAGDSIYSGRTGQLGGDQQLRAVLKFDLSAIPQGSVISSASLALYQVATVSGGQETTLHRMLADWGEGSSAF